MASVVLLWLCLVVDIYHFNIDLATHEEPLRLKWVCVVHSETLMSSDEKRLTEEERDEDECDEDVDEERLEPRSDDEDT